MRIKKNFFSINLLVLLLLSINNSYAKSSYFDEGKKLFSQKKIDESKLKFEKDIVFNPKNQISYLYLAKIFKIKNNDKLYEQNLNTVILLNPKNEEAIYLLASLKVKQSNFDKSKELIETFKKVCVELCTKENELNNKLKNLQK